MKKILLLFTLAVATLITACSTGDEYIEINLPKNAADAELHIKLSVENSETIVKSIGDGDYQNEHKVTNSILLVFFEDGTVNIIRNFDHGTNGSSNIVTSLKSGSNMKIYVVSNVNSTLFDNVTSEEQFKAIQLTLNQLPTQPLTGNIPNATIVPYNSKDNSTITKYNMTLSRISFKVSIPSNSIHAYLDQGGYPNAVFKLDKVFLHNVNSKSTVDYVTSEPKSGIDDASLINFKPDFYTGERHFFYGFESKVKLILGGLFKDGAREEYLYYPIEIDAKHNTHYQVSVTIKGKGVKNPDDLYETSGKLDLTLKIANWENQSIDQVFE